MHRPDHSSADPDGISSGVAGYTDGNPGALPPVPPTKVVSKHMNDLGESLCRVVEAADVALVAEDYDQLWESIVLLAGREAERRALLTPSIMPTTTGTSYGLVGVASDGAGNVAAVGISGGACYAQDSANHGATFAQASLDTTMEEVFAVAWNGSRFVALGYDTSATQPGLVYRAATGAWSAWVAITGAAYGSKLTAITWTGSAWVAVGENGKAWYTTSSTPSSGWTEVTTYTGMTNHLYGIASSATRTVACGTGGGSGDGRITHTADPTAASAWTVVTLPDNVGGVIVCYSVATDGAGRWVFGQDDGYIAVTDNLTTFTSYLLDGDASDIGAMCHTGKHFVALATGSGASAIYVSKDGVTWVGLQGLSAANVKAINAESFCYIAGQIGSDKALFRSGSLL